MCAEVAGLDTGSTERAVARLNGLGLCDAGVPGPAVRDAVLDGMDAASRRRAHERAGRVLDSRAAPADRVADHYLHAGPPADGGVVELLHAAAAAAVQRGEPALAASLLRHALGGPVSGRRRAELLVDLGLAERPTDPEGALGRLTEALSLLDSARERAGVLAHTVPLLSGVDAAGLLRLLDGGLRELAAEAGAADEQNPTDRELRYALEALRVYAASEDVAHVGRVWDWVDRTDPRDLGPGAGADALRSAHLFFSALGLRTDAESVAVAAREVLAGELEDSEYFQPIRMGALGLLSWTERDDELGAVLARALGSEQLRHRPDVQAFVRGLRSMVHLRCGRMPEARDDALATLAVLSNAVGAEARLLVLHSAALALVELGEPDRAAAMLWPDSVVGASERSWRWSWVLDARAGVLAATGRAAEGLAEAQEAGRRLTALGIVNPATLDWRRRVALLHHLLGERETAVAVAREHLAACRRWGTRGHVGVALRVLGAVRGGPEGIATLREARAELAHTSRLFDRAHCAVDLGAQLGRDGATEARDLLREGLDLADECGARVLADRARAELVAAGGRPRRAGGPVLTPAEQDVARLAARGVSNPDIARELGVSRRAVEGHLTRCYRKLGIAGRAQLAASLPDRRR